MLKKKLIKILIGGLGGLVLVFAGFIYLNSKRTDFRLSIIAQPKGSVIKINGAEEGKDTFSKTLPKGLYQITTEKEDYISDEREINLNADTKLEINLIKKLGLSAPPDKFRFKSTQSVSVYSPKIINDTTIVGYDKELRMVFSADEDSFTKIYTGDLIFYSFSDLYVVFADRKVKNKIFLYNIKENKTANISTSEIAPVIYASYSSEYDVVLLLGRYDSKTRVSSVYAAKTTGPGFQLLTTTTANVVEPLKDNLIVLFEKLDNDNSSIINILDLKTFNIVYSSIGNKYIISPSKKSMAIVSSDKITLIDLSNFSKRDIKFSKTDKIVWNDEISFLLINNKHPGVSYSYLETEYGEETKEVEIKELESRTIKEIIGKSDGFLYLRDTEGAIWKISLN